MKLLFSLLTWLFTTLFFGLFQVWITAFILYVNVTLVNILDVTKDGGLFFFATSLAASSFLNHAKMFKNAPYEEVIFSVIFALVLIVFSSVSFASGYMKAVPTKPGFVSNQNQEFVGYLVSGFGIIYGIITEIRVNFFLNKKLLN
ncbi:hypothetical protein [uncultured Fibrella sp.]|uniref:hypothetical protein n=1 Tax=uncultured Fibrella sp. TaxID=1284596 RepID=UPI0035CB5ACA